MGGRGLKMKLFHTFAAFILCFFTQLPFSSLSYADCGIPYGQDAINKFPVIIEAVVTEDNSFLSSIVPGLYNRTSFKISKSFKGPYGDDEVITVRVNGTKYKSNMFQEGKSYLVFLYNYKSAHDYYTGPCTPSFSYEAINSHGGFGSSLISTLIEVVKYSATSDKERTDLFKGLSKKMPDIYELYEQQGQLLAKNKKYGEALELYELAIATKYKTWIKREYGDKGPGGDLGRYNQLLDKPLTIPADAVIHQVVRAGDVIFEYALALYDIGQYSEAAEILKIAESGSISRDNRERIEKLKMDLSDELKKTVGVKN